MILSAKSKQQHTSPAHSFLSSIYTYSKQMYAWKIGGPTAFAETEIMSIM